MSRFLTHMKKLRDPEEPLSRFFNLFGPMQSKMGPVLFQLPDMLRFNAEVAKPFYEAFRTGYPTYHAVLEIRHPSWLSDESLGLMQDFSMGLVVNQSGTHWPYSEIITSTDVYLRFHGPRQLYASSYSDEDLSDYADKMKAWAASGHNVWAFFNNDIHGFAPRDAARLQAMLA